MTKHERRELMLRVALLGLVTGVILAVIVVVLVVNGGSSQNAPLLTDAASAPATFAADQSINGTSTPSVEEAAVAEAANRFVSALAAGDGDALYALQTEEYKKTCSRQEFDVVVAALKVQPLKGPARARVQGNDAAVRLFTTDDHPAVVSMKKEADGSWRVVARASGGCL